MRGPEATAQLASLLEDLGAVVATTTLAGQPVALTGAEPAKAEHAPWAAHKAALHAEIPRPAPLGLPASSIAAAQVAASTLAEPAPFLPAGERAAFSSLITATPALDRAQLRGQTPAASEPIRLHADWSADGVRLWLGMDASLAGTLPSITLQLQRWLSSQGVRVLSISCNGRVVLDEHESAASDVYQPDVNTYGPASAPAYSHPHQKESS